MGETLMLKRSLASMICALLLLGQPLPVFAEPGVSDKEIVIGSCNVQTGPAAQLGIKQTMGAQAYLNRTNDAGGVNGRKIKLVVYDDKYEPDAAVVCFK